MQDVVAPVVGIVQLEESRVDDLAVALAAKELSIEDGIRNYQYLDRLVAMYQDRGIDLHGICLFPGVDMPNWHTGEWLHNGICDLVDEGGSLRRIPFQPYVEELRRWQRELNRVTVLDEDPFSDPVELQDVVHAAERMRMNPDKDWS